MRFLSNKKRIFIKSREYNRQDDNVEKLAFYPKFGGSCRLLKIMGERGALSFGKIIQKSPKVFVCGKHRNFFGIFLQCSAE